MSPSPRKSLGQHFLTDRALLARIAAATGATSQDVVLEIGPGRGALTDALLDRGATVVGVERDARLRDGLVRRFAGREFVLVAADALEVDWPALVDPWTSVGRRWLVAGNIPYNITSPLLEKALTPPWPAAVTFLVQREVADRVVATAGSKAYGGLSAGIQVVADAKRLITVGKGAFSPPPKVDSALLHLVPRDPPLLPPDRVGDFRKLVTSLFSYRRKRMLRALREATGLDASECAALLDEASIDPDLRPEMIAPERFLALLGAFERRQAGAGQLATGSGS